MGRLKLLAGAAWVLAGAGIAQAETLDPLAVKFGVRETVRSLSISPDGRKIVFVSPRADGGENAVVYDLASGNAVPVLSSGGVTDHLYGCRFVLAERVVCTIGLRDGKERKIDMASRLASVSADGKDMKMLTARDGVSAYFKSRHGGEIIDYAVAGNPDAVLMTRYFPPEVQTGALASRSREGMAVEQVDLVTLARKIVEPARATATDYVSDGYGAVRVMETQDHDSQGYAQDEVTYSYRPVGGAWTVLGDVKFGSGMAKGFAPVAVDRASDSVYGFDYQGNFKALFKMPLNGSNQATLVLGRPDVDVDHLVRIGRNRRVVGVSYATEKRTIEYFDDEIGKLAGSLAKALGNGRSVWITDATQDEGKLVVYSGADTDPGRYFIYDKATHRLQELLQSRPELEGMKLAVMKPVEFPAADGTKIPGYLSLPPGSSGKGIPAIVMPHGGPHARDEWGFDWLVQFFTAKGYAVLQPNFRGSAGFGQAWFQQNGFKSWPTAIGDVNDAGRWLIAQGVTTPDKLAIVGWSYGGYAALQSAVVEPDLFKAIVAIAPVTDLDLTREQWRDYANFYIQSDFIGQGPHVDSGSPARHADRFKAPVLLVHGDVDLNVGVNSSRLMRDRLKAAGKQVDYIEFPELDHQLDSSAARARMLSAADAHIRKTLGL